MKFALRARGREHEVELQWGQGRLSAQVGERVWEIEDFTKSDVRLCFKAEGQEQDVYWAREGREVWVYINGHTYHFEKSAGERGTAAGSGAGEKVLRAPMPGQVREVLVTEGEQVEAGAVLLLLEAMKMEIRVLAPRGGRVESVAVAAGESVEKEQILVELDGE